MRHISKAILIVVLSISITACGFHLRGQLPLPETANVIYIDADNTDFTDELIDKLQAAGAEIVDDPSAAKAILQIADEYAEREALTLNTSGRASSYKLFYTVEYLIANSEQELLKEGILEEQSQYSFESGQAVLQETEESELLEEMYEELAIRMVRQFSFL